MKKSEQKNKVVMRIMLCISTLLLLASSAVAQQTIVKGKVTAFNSYAITGAEVKAKKSKLSVKTDSLGNYEIACKNKDVLFISAEGFLRKRFVVKESGTINCNLILMSGDYAQKKVVANGHMRLKDIQYAVENLMSENNDFGQYQHICDLLQAKYPMVRCDQFEGVNRVFIGSQPQSLSSGHYALCVVDGIITDDITDISPMQIASIKVLTADDAASYGSRAAAGVLEIILKH